MAKEKRKVGRPKIKVDKEDLESNKYKYKLHYIYREFQIDFFNTD